MVKSTYAQWEETVKKGSETQSLKIWIFWYFWIHSSLKNTKQVKKVKLQLWSCDFNQGWLLKTGTKNEQISDFANFCYINNATLQHIMSPGVHRVVKGDSYHTFLIPMVYKASKKSKNLDGQPWPMWF